MPARAQKPKGPVHRWRGLGVEDLSGLFLAHGPTTRPAISGRGSDSGRGVESQEVHWRIMQQAGRGVNLRRGLLTLAAQKPGLAGLVVNAQCSRVPAASKRSSPWASVMPSARPQPWMASTWRR